MVREGGIEVKRVSSTWWRIRRRMKDETDKESVRKRGTREGEIKVRIGKINKYDEDKRSENYEARNERKTEQEKEKLK